MVWRGVPGLLTVGLMVLVGMASAAPSGGDEPVSDAWSLDADVLDRLLAGGSVPLRLGPATHAIALMPEPVFDDARFVAHRDGMDRDLPAPEIDTWRLVFEEADWRGRLMRGTDGAWFGVILPPAGHAWLLSGTDAGLLVDPAPVLDLGPFGADALEAPDQGPGNEVPVDARNTQAPADGTLRMRLALEADYQYFFRNADWMDDLVAAVLVVDAVYEQIDTTIELSWAGVWETPDPYTSQRICTTTQVDKLDQFRSYWERERDDVARDAAHLASANIQGNTIGCAFIRQLDDAFAYGVNLFSRSVSQSEESGHLRSGILMSHELGHNFDGRHQRSMGPWALTGLLSSVPPYTIMNPVAVNSLPRFSELGGVHSPETGWEMDNAGHMRAYAESRLDLA